MIINIRGVFIRNSEISLLYGRAFWQTSFQSLSHIAVAGGVSYLTIVRRGDFIASKTYETDITHRIGLPLNLEWAHFPASGFMAVSLDVFANINSYDSHYGFLVMFGFNL